MNLFSYQNYLLGEVNRARLTNRISKLISFTTDGIYLYLFLWLHDNLDVFITNQYIVVIKNRG